MKLTNQELLNFIGRIKLKRENMPKYREQAGNLISEVQDYIKNDDENGIKITRVLKAGSWKKGTILRPTGANAIDFDLVFFVEGDESFNEDIQNLHDFIVKYLKNIYPNKDISKDVDAEGKTKAIKIKFISTGLEIDIVPVVPINSPKNYVWQPERGGGGRYTTSIDGQLTFAKDVKDGNSSYTSIVRALKWWRNYKELDEILPSFAIELMVSYLEIENGVEQNIEEGIIRCFQFISSSNFPVISFTTAINKVPSYDSPIFIGDPTNNENNVVKKMTQSDWDEIVEEADEAFDTLNIAQSTGANGRTLEEWKKVFGPKFNITEEE